MYHFTRTSQAAAVLAFAVFGFQSVGRSAETPGEPAAADELPVAKLVVVPAAEPDPPLQYLLTPAYADLKPGNAATNYYRAITLLPHEEPRQFGDTQQQWLDAPLAEFPREEARKWLEPYRAVLEEIRVATFRESCDWNHRLRELTGIEPLAFLLPELQQTRTLARVIRVKARLELAEGKFTDALATLTMGYRLAANIAQSPTLVSALVGIAVGRMMNEGVLDWIGAGGPNLYWALASLPDPLLDIRAALQQEMMLPLQLFPFLKDPEHAEQSAEQWRKVIGDSIRQMASIGSDNQTGSSSDLAGQAMGLGLILAGYAAAKQQLIESGMDPALVEPMPVGQVVAVQSARAYRKVYQQSMKWTLLPYWQSHQQMRATFAELDAQGFLGNFGGMPGVIPIAPMLLPSIEPAVFAPVRLQRELAALQTIEALRMAAARTGGQLPKSLEELSFAPPPIDELTGRLIDYQLLDTGVAVLTLSPPEGKPANSFGKRYELQVKK